MSSTKNPENEAENPASMPRAQQGQGGHAHQTDPANHGDPQGQQGKRAKMAPRHDAPPGLEQDSLGNTIPLAQRTEEDQQKVRAATQHKS